MAKKSSGFTEMDVIEKLGLLNSILESSTEYSIIAMDLDDRILVWNVGAQQLYGYTATEVIGKNSAILHNPDDIKLGKVKKIFDVVHQKGVWTGEVQRVRKDGSHFTALVTITLRKNSNNTAIGYTLISRDVSELQNALHNFSIVEASEKLLLIKNTELEEITRDAENSNRLKSEFLANVSHELRTPLNGIIGFAELIYDGAVKPNAPQYKEFLGDIISSSNQLLALINDVLDLAKIEADKMEFHPEKIEFDKLLTKIKDTFQTIISEKNIKLEIKIHPFLDDIVIDAEKLLQVFYNYISNALKFTPSNGQVSVSINPDAENTFRLEVEDTGIGIHQEDLNKLFGKFHQLDSGSSKKYPGTGLGLALTKRIVEAQGGKVGANSIYGKGSVFYAILPRQPRHWNIVLNQNPPKKALEENIKKLPTILVIERESRDRTLIVDALAEAGYIVITAENMMSAIEQHREHQFDAIILDLFQPDMNKWEIIRSLRSKLPAQKAPPVIVKVMLEKPVSLGFKIHDFLTKPIQPETLLSALTWIGATSQHHKTILVIDDDQKALDFATQTLTKHGYRVVCVTSKISGLLALEKEQPDAVLLNPFMSGIDGFEFLRNYRETERGLYTPLIIWTKTKLTDEERSRFKNSIQRIMLTGDDLKKSILLELEKSIAPLNSNASNTKEQ